MQKVFVIGSGPIVIGQAAEFDYSGTQAIKALKEQGLEVILLNNNPATIMTDLDLVDVLYSEPMSVDSCIKIIQKHTPDAIVLGMGGQTSLNLGMKLYHQGVLDEYKVAVLGTHPKDIERAEDREIFKNEMIAIGEPVMPSASVNTYTEALITAERIGYPVIVRPAFTLGGFGGGICTNEKELKTIALEGLQKSPVNQVLIEKSVYGWKEIEYEMMRDHEGNVIAVCNMENMDPVGIHTGDSIVVAPSQTLNDQQYQMLRKSSIRVVNHLNIIGGCNVQFALSPTDNQYYLIEVNPRVSRSSALASKATGYAIAKIAMLIGLGHTLDTIQNQVTKKTMACHEPTLDYCVVKMPRWPYDKLKSSHTTLGTVMRATGEVMAIGITFEEALLKAIRSLDLHTHDLYDVQMKDFTNEELMQLCADKSFNRLFALAELVRRDLPLEAIWENTHIDYYFLKRIKKCVDIEKTLKGVTTISDLDQQELRRIKCLGFSNSSLSKLSETSLDDVIEHLEMCQIAPVYRMVDTCGGEFEAHSNYLYSSYHGSNESVASNKKKIIVVGSGPIRIGQGVEFDYSSVKALMAIRKMGYEAIMINNNPETVSTDHDLSDKLYFEPITVEDVLAIVKHEKPFGVMLQYGGQTAIKLAKELELRGVNLIGTSSSIIDTVEDRALFYEMLDTLLIPRAKGSMAATIKEAIEGVAAIGYPVLLRPSFVIGGQDMAIIRNEEELSAYFGHLATKYTQPQILIDQYLEGVELEVDALSDGQTIFIPGFMEHLDQAGVHSGDSVALYPARMSKDDMLTVYDIIEKICRQLDYRGVINFQFVKLGQIHYVLEVNPRASRSLPFISKVTKMPMLDWSVGLALGSSFKDLGMSAGILKAMPYAAVKAPVFSSEKLIGIDALLGPNMLSTGESMFVAPTLEEALDKLLYSEGISFTDLNLLMHVSDCQKQLYEDVNDSSLVSHSVQWVDETLDLLSDEALEDWVLSKNVNLFVTTNDFKHGYTHLGHRLRKLAIEKGISLMMSPDKFKLLLQHMKKSDHTFDLFALNA
jgi:carbamoyl-phosphate synthase large subunit